MSLQRAKKLISDPFNKRDKDSKNIVQLCNKIKTDFLTLCKNANIADSNIVVSDYEGFNNYFYFKRGKKQNPDLFSAIRYVIRFNEMSKVNALADGLDDEAVQRFEIINVTHSKITEFRKQLKISA